MTVCSAIHYHPKEKGDKVMVLPPFINRKVIEKPRHLSKVYYRNLGYINKTYGKRGFLMLEGAFIFYSIYLLRTFQLREYCNFLKYYLRGRRDNFED